MYGFIQSKIFPSKPNMILCIFRPTGNNPFYTAYRTHLTSLRRLHKKRPSRPYPQITGFIQMNTPYIIQSPTSVIQLKRIGKYHTHTFPSDPEHPFHTPEEFLPLLKTLHDKL